MDTPELDKMKSVQAESQAIGKFLEWLEEKGMFIGRYENDNYINAISESNEQLLADYFEIDLKLVEKERVALLKEFRDKERKKIQPS